MSNTSNADSKVNPSPGNQSISKDELYNHLMNEGHLHSHIACQMLNRYELAITQQAWILLWVVWVKFHTTTKRWQIFPPQQYQNLYNETGEFLGQTKKEVKASLQGMMVWYTVNLRDGQDLMLVDSETNHTQFRFAIDHSVLPQDCPDHGTLYKRLETLCGQSKSSKNSRGTQNIFGYHTTPTQKTSKALGYPFNHAIPKPMLLSNNTEPKTSMLRGNVLEPLVRNMWRACQKSFPRECEYALDCIPEQCRFPVDTGFSQVTLALSNPTRFHYDNGNMPDTMTCIYIVTNGEKIRGGQQLIKDGLNNKVIVVQTMNGMLIMGNYTSYLHGVVDVIAGERLVVIAYSQVSIAVYHDKYKAPQKPHKAGKRKRAEMKLAH